MTAIVGHNAQADETQTNLLTDIQKKLDRIHPITDQNSNSKDVKEVK